LVGPGRTKKTYIVMNSTAKQPLLGRWNDSNNQNRSVSLALGRLWDDFKIKISR